MGYGYLIKSSFNLLITGKLFTSEYENEFCHIIIETDQF
jgi:hypothetical protein